MAMLNSQMVFTVFDVFVYSKSRRLDGTNGTMTRAFHHQNGTMGFKSFPTCGFDMPRQGGLEEPVLNRFGDRFKV